MIESAQGRQGTAELLTIDDVTVEFGDERSPIRAVANATLSVRAGEIVGIAGESGSGKSTLCSALVRALPASARMTGRVLFQGRDLRSLSESQMRALRGRDLAMIVQNPMTSLDPLFTIGSQVGEVLHERHGYSRADSVKGAVDVLRRVHLTAPDLRTRQYPHQLSGGMRQRVLTGMATAGKPKLVIADEPTTALDATIQEEILLLFREIRDRVNAAIIIVTHDLGVIRRLCDRIVVMYAGSIVESGPAAEIFAAPKHPYTRALLDALPRIEDDDIVLRPIGGQVPNLAKLGPGCSFADRCVDADDQCRVASPPVVWIDDGHRSLCWRAEPRQ